MISEQTMYYGIIPPMITPLIQPDKLDHEGTEKLIEHILDGGVHGLFILGTTGEGPGLSYEIRYELTKLACQQVNGRVPLLVGITDTSFSESVRLAEHAASWGANAVVAAPPYYFSSNQQELIGYYQTLADRSPLPVFLYNMPSHTKLNFAPETIKTLSEHPNIIGFKDSSGDVIYFQKVLSLLKDRPDFPVFVGPEEILMQTMLSGGHGGVNGGANMFPKLYVAMYEAALEKDLERMDSIQEQILQISSTLYTIGNSPAKYLQGVKCTLSIMGICNDTLALPYRAFDSNQRKAVQSALELINQNEIPA